MNDVWQVRDSRAEYLIGELPHAAELLTFYRHVLAAQASVYDDPQVTGAFAHLVNVQTDSVADVSNLPMEDIGEAFARFVEQVGTAAPEVTAGVGRSVLQDPAGALDWFLGRSEEVRPDWQVHTAIQLEFYPRAFLQPVFQRISVEIPNDYVGADDTVCPLCGELPQLSILRDEPDAKGQRRLVCSLCSRAWRFPRVTCPNCHEASADKLFRHEDEAASVSHVAVEECASCSHYIKSIDLRKNGRAEPVVDEIATVALDLWARERGLAKIRMNVLAM